MLTIRPAVSAADLVAVRALLEEYATWLAANGAADLPEPDERASLPGRYAPPAGALLLAKLDGRAVGCVALRALDAETCEMKRLFVRPEARGARVGVALVEALLAHARATGYRRMRLDTLAWMHPAIALYRALGFREIAPYHDRVGGVRFFERALAAPVAAGERGAR